MQSVRSQALALALLLLAAACTDSPAETSTSATPTTTPPPTTITTTTATTLTPLKDLSERPQIWFGPQPPLPTDPEGRQRLAPEFYDLFDVDARWQDAAKRVHVFRFFGEWAAWTSTDQELRAVVSDLNRRGIAIGYEGGPLTPSDDCTGATIEGFAGPEEARVIVDRLASAGGTIHFGGLEHGFDAAVVYGPEYCRMTPIEVGEHIARYLDVVRAVFPDVTVDLIETAGLDLDTIADWLEAYRTVLGEYPDNVQLDIDHGRPDWPYRARAIEDHVNSLGIGFGIFYLGEWDDITDADWLAHAWERVVEYEVINGGSPEQPIFESWHPRPPMAITRTSERVAASPRGLLVAPPGARLSAAVDPLAP